MPRPRWLAPIATAAVALFVLAGPVAAHPLGNFSLNHYTAVYVSRGAIDVDQVIDIAELPAIEVLRRIDSDGDRTLSAAESEAARRPLCAERVGGLDIRVNGQRLALDLTAAGVHQQPGVGGLTTLRIVCESIAMLTLPEGAVRLAVADTGDAGRVGWREIVVRGDGLQADVPEAAVDISQRLTSYPTDLLVQPLELRALSVTLEAGGPPLARPSISDATPLDAAVAAGTEVIARAVPAGAAAELAAVGDLANLSLGAALLGILLAAVAGGGHALSPGHGKTIMAAYLVGTNGRARHALLLGLAVTLSHTLGVVALAALVLAATDVLPPEQLYPVLTFASGAAVTIIGGGLLIGLRRPASHAHHHEHGHDHGPAHRHGWRVHSHALPAAVAAPHTSAALPGGRSLLAIGLAGGLVPSPAALVLLLAAVAAGQPAYGLLVAVSFGAGMAAVLSGIGLLIVHGKRRLGGTVERARSRLPLANRLATAAPWIIALFITASGVLLSGQALATRF